MRSCAARYLSDVTPHAHAQQLRCDPPCASRPARVGRALVSAAGLLAGCGLARVRGADVGSRLGTLAATGGVHLRAAGRVFLLVRRPFPHRPDRSPSRVAPTRAPQCRDARGNESSPTRAVRWTEKTAVTSAEFTSRT